MPTAPLRPCARHGCPALVPGGYCAAHAGPRATNGKARQGWATPSRYAAQRLRGRAWMAMRKEVMAEEAHCYLCRLVRGRMNSCLVRFVADGYLVVTSRNYVRKGEA